VIFLGEDQEAYETILGSTFGFAKPSLYEIHRGDILKGFVSERDSSDEFLRLDVGVADPKRVLVTLPQSVLRAQLCDGRPVGLDAIADVLCLREDVPVGLRIARVNEESIECWLSDKAVERFDEWRDLPLERLVIVGASHATIVKAIDYAKLNRDVAKLDSISVLVQVVTAKIGTRARGLVRPLGSRLGNARIHLFDPVNARNLLGKARGC
jgi:hypothetical protein